MFRKITALVLLALVALALMIAAPLRAAPNSNTFTVNTTADATDVAPGDGVCETAPATNNCTLRAAIQETNALAGADTIILQPATTYILTLFGSDDLAAKGDLDITDALTINGGGANSTIIDGNGSNMGDRVFDIRSNGTPTVNISNVTIRNGKLPPGNVGGPSRTLPT